MMRKKLTSAQWLGAVGSLLCVAIFIREPSFPTPDKLLVFATFVCLFFGQATEMLKRFVPLVGLLLVYESFRGIVPHLNSHVNYTWMPNVDRWMFFGHLPTVWLQSHLWHGSVQWFDFMLYLTYMLHFVLPLGLAVAVWKLHDSEYWRYAAAYLAASFAAFVTFLLFPAAPPWMASNMGIIEPIERVSSHVWAALGIHDFPSLYNQIAPNPVAAVPSLHAAYATLFALFAITLFKSRWRFLSLIYPLFIYFGTVYQGEHYVIDEILGALYGILAFLAAPYVVRAIVRCWKPVERHIGMWRKALSNR